MTDDSVMPDAEQRLRDADAAFDGGPASRRRALETYADLAGHLDARTPIGLRRLLRILSHPTQIDPRLEHAFGVAACVVPDRATRTRIRAAAIRWAIDRQEFGRARAASRALLAEFPSPPGPPAAVWGYPVAALGSAGAVEELVAAVAHMEQAPRESAADVAYVIQSRVLALVRVEDWRGALRAAESFETARSALDPAAMRCTSDAVAVRCAHAHRRLGDVAAARRCLRSVDASTVPPGRALEMRLAEAANCLADGDAGAAFAAAIGVHHDRVVTAGQRVQSLALAATAADAAGREAEALEVAGALCEVVEAEGDRIGLEPALEALADATNAVARPGAVPEQAASIVPLALRLAASRIRDLAAFVATEGGFAHLGPHDTGALRRWRAGRATRRRLLLHETDRETLRAGSPARLAVDEALGGAETWTVCPSCLVFFRPGRGDAPLPVGHLFGERFRAAMPRAICPACETDPAALVTPLPGTPRPPRDR